MAENSPDVFPLYIKAGQTETIPCPQHPHAAGDILQSSEGKKIFYVIQTNKESLSIGPLVAGEHSFSLTCNNKAKTFKSKVLLPQKMPSLNGPLGFTPFSYNAYSVLGLVALVIIPIILSFLGYKLFSYFKNRKYRLKNVDAISVPLSQQLQKHIKLLKTSSILKEVNSDKVRSHYDKAVNLTRKYLEETLSFDGYFMSHSEFIRQCKIKTNSHKLHHSDRYFAELETFLLQSDRVRFSKIDASLEQNKQFFNYYNDLSKSALDFNQQLEKKALEEQKKPIKGKRA